MESALKNAPARIAAAQITVFPNITYAYFYGAVQVYHMTLSSVEGCKHLSP